MANIALRAYLDDLAHLIDQEALEEVIGHCKYILTKFPKNVAVYRLYGTALAGKSRYDEARDIFERVLSAVPGDFAAHVSMSEIFQEQGLEGIARAIWHLERAFEQDPNNAALQDELKRLYDQRDGAPPETINLTRGALARLYYKSQLYDQAAAELNIALRENPDRPDLLILLAEAQWDNHRPVEAGETALRILQNFPYSLDGNRIMAKLWLRHNRPSDAQAFIGRLAELDPFEALELVKAGDENAKAAITIQRLDWNARSSATMLTNAPDWVQGMGDFFDAPAASGGSDPFAGTGDWTANFTAPTDVPVPKTDWFSSSSPFAQAAQAKAAPDLPDWFADVQIPAAQPAPAIPDWLQDVEETPSDAPHVSTGFTDLLNEFGTPATTQNTPENSGFNDLLNEFGGTTAPDAGFNDLMNEFGGASASAAATADPAIPDWLQGSEGATDLPGDAGGAALPDWMQGAPQDFPELPTDFADKPTTDDWIAAPAAESNLPDWMNDAPAFDLPNVSDTSGGSADDLPAMENVPDWLSGSEPMSDLPAEPASDIPDWLNAPQASTTTAAELPAPEFADFLTGSSESVSDLPADDWLSDLGTPQAGTFDLPAESTAAGADDWLNAMPEIRPAGDLLAQPADDWMKDLGSPIPPEADAPVAESTGDDNDWLAAMPDLDMNQFRTPLENAETAPDDSWLNDLSGASVDAPIEPLVTASDMPAWVDEGAPELQVGDAGRIGPESDPLDWMADPLSTMETVADEQPDRTASQPISSLFDQEDDWLSGMRGDQTVQPAQPEDALSTDQLLDWMSEESITPAASVPTQAETDLESINLDDWMTGLAAEPTDMISAQPETTPQADAAPELAASSAADDDWLRNFEITDEPAVTVSSGITPEAMTTTPASELPIEEDWLTSFEPEGGTALGELPAQEQSPVGDSWLDQLAANAPRERLTLQEAVIEYPEDTSAPAEIDWGTPPEPVSSGDDWLNTLGTSITPASEQPVEPEDTTPEWMKELPSIEPTARTEGTETGGAAPKKSGMTDLLGRIKKGEDTPPPRRETGVLDPNRLPDWMNVLGDEPVAALPDEPEQPEPSAIESPVAAEPAPEPIGEISMDWLNDLANPPPEQTEGRFAAASEAISDTPDWLQDTGDTMDQAQAEPTAQSDLDWLNDIRAQAPEFDDLPTETVGTTREDEPTIAGDVPDWMQGIASVEGAEAMIGTPTDDLNDLRNLEFSTEARADFDFGTVDELQADADANAADDIDINALLRELNAGGLAKEGELVENTSNSRFTFERLPAWLRKRNN